MRGFKALCMLNPPIDINIALFILISRAFKEIYCILSNFTCYQNMFSWKQRWWSLPRSEVMVFQKKVPWIIVNQIKQINISPANSQTRKHKKEYYLFWPFVKTLNKIIWGNVYLLNINEEVRKTFWPGPMISFGSPWKVRSCLYRAKFMYGSCM